MQISKNKLINGIECLAIHDEDCPSVTATILVKHGSRYEEANQSGIVHLIEHMIFKGTKKRPTSKIIAFDVELLGGIMNAFTSYEYTGFYLKAPKQNFIKLVEILADFFQNSTFNSQELVKEKNVILEEIKMYEDIPMSKIEEIFLEQIFKNHPLGRNIAGTKETLSTISAEDCISYVKQNFVRENLLLVVAGSFSNKDMLVALDNEFGKITSSKKLKIFSPANKIPLSRKILKVKKNIEQTHVVMGGFLDARNKKNRIPILLGNYILSGGFGSKLFQKIREDLGLVYYINLDANQFEDIGFYSINFGLDSSKVNQAIDSIQIELENFLKGDVLKRELERAKNFWIGNLSSNIETSEELANWYGIKYLLEKEIMPVDKYMLEINNTSLEEVICEWKKYLNLDNMTIVTLGRE